MEKVKNQRSAAAQARDPASDSSLGRGGGGVKKSGGRATKREYGSLKRRTHPLQSPARLVLVYNIALCALQWV